MTSSSISGGERAATRARGRDVDALGPSDSSDSGSDVQGERAMATEGSDEGELGSLPSDGGEDSDAFGTGVRASATGADPRDAADIVPDRIIGGAAASDGDIDDSVSIEDIAADSDDDVESATEQGSGEEQVP